MWCVILLLTSYWFHHKLQTESRHKTCWLLMMRRHQTHRDPPEARYSMLWMAPGEEGERCNYSRQQLEFLNSKGFKTYRKQCNCGKPHLKEVNSCWGLRAGDARWTSLTPRETKAAGTNRMSSFKFKFSRSCNYGCSRISRYNKYLQFTCYI